MKNSLFRLRDHMKKLNVPLYVLPRTDEHQNQYLSPASERVKYISNFTGSNALTLISQSQALLWTDGRYYLQAQKQLSNEWKMMKLISTEKKWFQYIAQAYKETKPTIQIDARLINASLAKEKKKYFQDKGFIINFEQRNLVDDIWLEKPLQDRFPIYSHEKHAGRTIQEKISWIRNKIIEKNAQGALFTDLGEIAWILNLRSSQFPFNPFFKSILVVNRQGGYLYLPKMHPSLSDEQIKAHLSREKIKLEEYQARLNSKLLCQSSQLNYSIYRKIKQPVQWDGIGLFRAVRNQKELNGFKSCHIRDAIAQVKFWAWRSSLDSINQYDAACYIDNLRKQQDKNMGLSFATISGGGPNGAIIHYHATPENSSIVTKDMIHLVDSGGQYLDGTTDVTRAFHFGTPTAEQKDAYTRVLLGNLQVQRLKWPKLVKLSGVQIDILARKHLWKKGLDYAHGTGHGVGHFGSVHEGPLGISRFSKTVFEPNMIVTNQPGYYSSGKFGIRIENMLYVRQYQNQLLGFENLTLCPYDKNLLSMEILSKEDINYINEYHQRIWDTLSPILNNDLRSLEWLKNVTSPITIV